MNENIVRKNLEHFLDEEIEKTIAAKSLEDAQKAYNETCKKLKGARSFIRKAIKEKGEVIISGVYGKDYKVFPDPNDEFGVIIKTIHIIK